MVARVLFPVLTCGQRAHTPTPGRPSRPTLPHIIRPRPYGAWVRALD